MRMVLRLIMDLLSHSTKITHSLIHLGLQDTLRLSMQETVLREPFHRAVQGPFRNRIKDLTQLHNILPIKTCGQHPMVLALC